MSTRDKKEGSGLTLVEAVETLSSIADLEFNHEVGIAQGHEIQVNDQALTFQTVHWLHKQDASLTIAMVKETFRVVLNYLRDFYQREYQAIYNQQALDEIKTIMVLVGEAAKKLDKYTNIFHKSQNKSVTELKEYKKLQEFYLNRVARKVDEGLLGKWILALSQKTGASHKHPLKLLGKTSQTKHVFVDLESVKKDTEYELFCLRKEDGTRFFSPRLIRNLKLVSDFGDYFGEGVKEEVLLEPKRWQDRIACSCAKNIIKATRGHIERFYREIVAAKQTELIEGLNKALMALMLAGNQTNLKHGLPVKDCADYFHDFQYFLRGCLHSREYQRLITYPSGKSNKLTHRILTTIHVICMAVYTQTRGYDELLGMVRGLLDKANNLVSKDHQLESEKRPSLWNVLARDYAAIAKLMKLHPNGPLNKILAILEEGSFNQFDPLMQQNFPSQLFSIYTHDQKCLFCRWPSPTYQEFINKACVTNEFKGFLRACAHEHAINKCLLFNLQDRVTWREHSRCDIIEDVPDHETFAKYIDVVTLAKDTEFYHQLTPYHQENHAHAFLKEFKEQLSDENYGFYFPEEIKKVLFKGFIDEALKIVHRIFFSGKNILLREHRLDFIEIFYFFLELKIFDICRPDAAGFVCKDGFDIGGTAAVEFFSFLKLLHQERLSEMDHEHVELMLYGPCLLCRERLILLERFNRMDSAIRTFETVRDQFGQAAFLKLIHEAFGDLYQFPIFQMKAMVQSNKDFLY